jgi:hypothetical protein
MKKISLLLNVLLVSFILFQSFKSDHAGSQPAVPDDSNPPAAFKGVDAALAKIMVENYKNGEWATLAKYNDIKRFDTRAVWFSLSTLKKFISVIEGVRERSGGKRCFDSLGIRLYNIKYPNSDLNSWDKYPYLRDGVPKSHANMQSLLMVPTYFDGTYNTDFDPKYISGCVPMSISQVFDSLTKKETPNKDFTFLAPGDWSGGAMTVQNKGTGTPPPYEGEGTNVTSDGKRWKRPCSGATFMDKCDGVICDTWYPASAASNSNQP